MQSRFLHTFIMHFVNEAKRLMNKNSWLRLHYKNIFDFLHLTVQLQYVLDLRLYWD